MERYRIVADQGAVLGIRYDPISRLVIIGGNIRFSTLIECFIQDSFGSKSWRVYTTATNKVRYEFRSRVRFSEVLENLISNEIIVEQVTSFGRLMR